MTKRYLTTTLLLSLSTSCLAASGDDLKWIAQDYQPYSYVNEQGQKAGLAVEIAAKIMQKIGSKQTAKDIDIQTFSRSFIRKNNDPNAVFFPLARSPEREKYFKWVGPIASDEPVLFAKKAKNITISSPEDLKQYKIAAKDGYNAVKMLKDMGVKSFELGTNDKEAIQKMQAGEVDLVVCNRLACLAAMKGQGLKMQDYNMVYKMEKGELAIAINKDTDAAVIAKIDQALNEMKANGEYEAIMKNHTR